MKKLIPAPKKVFLGIDVHKETYTITAIGDNTTVKKCTMIASPTKLVKFCEKFFPKAEIFSAYEAGFCGFGLHYYLISHGIQNIVVSPAHIEIAIRNRVKTDKRDSARIAEQLSHGRLRCVYIPEKEQERRRSVSRMRKQFMKDRVRIGNRLKSFLHYYGLIGHLKTPKVSKKWILTILEEVENEEKEIKFCIEMRANRWFELTEKIKKIDQQLEEFAKKDKHYATYLSVPGIGAQSAYVLSNELGDMSQFKSEKELFSYLGLTPREHSSGEHRYLGHISRQGKSCLRETLVEASWTTIRFDPSLGEKYKRLAKTKGPTKAIVAIARQLAGRIRACFKYGKLYEIKDV